MLVERLQVVVVGLDNLVVVNLMSHNVLDCEC